MEFAFNAWRQQWDITRHVHSNKQFSEFRRGVAPGWSLQEAGHVIWILMRESYFLLTAQQHWCQFRSQKALFRCLSKSTSLSAPSTCVAPLFHPGTLIRCKYSGHFLAAFSQAQCPGFRACLEGATGTDVAKVTGPSISPSLSLYYSTMWSVHAPCNYQNSGHVSFKTSTSDTALERKQVSDSFSVNEGQEKVIKYQTSNGCSMPR